MVAAVPAVAAARRPPARPGWRTPAADGAGTARSTSRRRPGRRRSAGPGGPARPARPGRPGPAAADRPHPGLAGPAAGPGGRVLGLRPGRLHGRLRPGRPGPLRPRLRRLRDRVLAHPDDRPGLLAGPPRPPAPSAPPPPSRPATPGPAPSGASRAAGAATTTTTRPAGHDHHPGPPPPARHHPPGDHPDDGPAHHHDRPPRPRPTTGRLDHAGRRRALRHRGDAYGDDAGNGRRARQNGLGVPIRSGGSPRVDEPTRSGGMQDLARPA